MQRELAEVSYIDGEYVFLKTSNASACGECSSKGACGSVKLFKPVIKSDELKVKNSLDLKKGDSVVLELAPSKLLQGTFLIYLFPLISLMVFAVLGKIVGGEGVSIITGLVGMAISLFFVSKYLSKKAVSQKFTPTMLEKGQK